MRTEAQIVAGWFGGAVRARCGEPLVVPMSRCSSVTSPSPPPPLAASTSSPSSTSSSSSSSSTTANPAPSSTSSPSSSSPPPPPPLAGDEGTVVKVLPPDAGERLEAALKDALLRKYAGHWYRHDPERGHAYRSLAVDAFQLDPVVASAARQAGLSVRAVHAALRAHPWGELVVFCDPFSVLVQTREGHRTHTLYVDAAKRARHATAAPPDAAPSASDQLQAAARHFAARREAFYAAQRNHHHNHQHPSHHDGGAGASAAYHTTAATTTTAAAAANDHSDVVRRLAAQSGSHHNHNHHNHHAHQRPFHRYHPSSPSAAPSAAQYQQPGALDAPGSSSSSAATLLGATTARMGAMGLPAGAAVSNAAASSPPATDGGKLFVLKASAQQ